MTKTYKMKEIVNKFANVIGNILTVIVAVAAIIETVFLSTTLLDDLYYEYTPYLFMYFDVIICTVLAIPGAIVFKGIARLTRSKES